MIYRRIVLITLALLLAFAFTVPVAAQADDPDPDGAYCNGTALKQHPVGARIAAQYELAYETVMGWFCQGYGFGQIKKAALIGELMAEDPGAILAEKTSLGGWGEVWKARGIGGPPPHAKAFKNHPGKGPKDKSGTDDD